MPNSYVLKHSCVGHSDDPLDPKGTEKAFEEVKRVLRPGGNLYISLPLDDENRTYFNAHRAFSEDYLKALFHPLALAEHRYIYGKTLRETPSQGFGVGLYHLQNS